MRKLHRQILLFLSVAIFVIVAPVLVFYSMGYRFDFKKFELIKVGMLIVETQPKETNIFLNNRQVDNSSPYKASALMPGNYKIRVEKKSFYSWKKTLPVKSRKVNWASHVRLFYEKPATKNLLQNQEFDEMKFLANENKIYLISNQQDKKGVFEYDLTSQKKTKLFPQKEEDAIYQNAFFENLAVSPDGKYVFFSWNNPNSLKNYMITSNSKVISLNNVFGYAIADPKWSLKNTNVIYWIYKNNLYSFDADSSDLPKVVLSNVFNFEMSSDYVYISKFEEDKNILKRTRENDFGSEDFLVEIPDNQGVLEIKAGLKDAVAFKSFDGILYLLKISKKDNKYYPAKIFDNAKDFAWSKEENKLLYYNDNEIWFYELINKTNDVPTIHYEYKINNPNLILRSASLIAKAIWHPDEEHILYSYDNKLHFIELDERSTKNTNVFDNFNVNDFEADEKGENLIYLDSAKNLFEARISEDDGLF